METPQAFARLLSSFITTPMKMAFEFVEGQRPAIKIAVLALASSCVEREGIQKTLRDTVAVMLAQVEKDATIDDLNEAHDLLDVAISGVEMVIRGKGVINGG